ncbi:hypothetical protein CEW87_07075 [Parazoarcus communis]|uniref:Integrase n=1 Tax=Parazoarcus communis TaxID=41977 RepID=A0A2U8H1T2_9RHOO|nr:site-specific integrase [Parazoarcus communis]AWI79146.1 hypothetical protein CEW87_07075 [Parazoarcus communis]
MNSREEIMSLLAPLARMMRIPDDLVGILVVARRLAPVLRSLMFVIDKQHKDLLSQSVSALEQIIDAESCVLQYFPDASGGGQKTLKGYYTSHPHYCVFWHYCADTEIVQQYGALLASMFPVQIKLERDRALIQTAPTAAYMVGLSLRQLTDRPDEALRAFLYKLSTEPMHPQALLADFDTHMHKLGLKPQVTGELRNLGYLHRALQWFETGTWEVHGHGWTGGKAKTHKAGRHGAIGGSEATRAISRTLESDDAMPDIDVTQFADDEGLSHKGDRDQDFSPPEDAPTRGMLLTVPPRAASAANRADRRTLARNVARYTAQAITLANQQLPITHATLSGFEMDLMLALIGDMCSEDWREIREADRPLVAAWAACRLFLSRTPEAVKALEVRNARTAKRNSSRVPSNMVWMRATARIWLPVESPRHVAPRIEGDSPMRTLPAAKGFDLELPPALANTLGQLAPAGEQLFQRSYEPEFAQLLAGLNKTRGTNLNPERVGRLIAKFMAQLGGYDRVFEFYFRGMPPNQHNPCVYSGVPVSRLQSLHANACSHLYRLAGRPPPSTASISPTSARALGLMHVGSLHVPTRTSVRTTVLTAIDAVATLASEPGAMFIERHNAYTAYCAFFLLATTGLRGVSSLLPASFDIDPGTGLCFISDKDNERYERSRIVWIHPMLLDQLNAYGDHVTRLRQYLALTNPEGIDHLDARERLAPLSSHASPDRNRDIELIDATIPTLFLLSKQNSKLTPTFPADLQHLLGTTWQLRIGALRHFFRTEMLHLGVPGPVINATLGHAERGEGPWDRFSSLPPLQWQRLAGAAITKICDASGFRVLSSPLLRSV